MFFFRNKSWLVMPVMLLAACANKPEPEDNFAFVVKEIDGRSHFQLNYFGPEQGKSSKSAPTERPNKGQGRGGRGGKGGREGQPTPASGPVPQGYDVMALLDKQLEQRQLCQQGFVITEQRPTSRGKVVIGHCR